MTRAGPPIILAIGFVVAALVAAYAQGVPSPTRVPDTDRLRVSYLGDVPRGATVTLRLADGGTITGRVVAASAEDVVTCHASGIVWQVKGAHIAALGRRE